MMSQMIASTTLLHEVLFELESGGGGSLWAQDHLLGTLTIRQRTGRQGRLSLRDTNRALDAVCYPSKQRKEYRLLEGTRSVARAEWTEGAPSARLYYGDRDYAAGPTGLFPLTPEFDDHPVVGLGVPVNWRAAQLRLRVEADADWALVMFYLFIAYDLFHVEASGQPARME
jgi:hypothetical protein